MNQSIINKETQILLTKMKSDGLNYIIAHPDNIVIFEQLKNEWFIGAKCQ